MSDEEKAETNVEEELKSVAELMEAVAGDFSVPRNIRKAVSDAREKILSEEDATVKISAAIYLLDDISNDINMPPHTRTEIWTIISDLEAIREKCK